MKRRNDDWKIGGDTNIVWSLRPSDFFILTRELYKGETHSEYSVFVCKL